MTLIRLSYTICFCRLDNGTEFDNKVFHAFLQSKGIVPEFSQPYMPELNGKAERSNRSITDLARTLLLSSSLSLSFWWFAVRYATYLLNRRPCLRRGFIPYEKFYQREVMLSHIRIFGSPGLAQLLVNPNLVKKFMPRAIT